MKATSAICISAFLIAIFVASNAVPRQYGNHSYASYLPSNTSKDLTAGQRVPGDYLYSRHYVYKPGMYNKIVEHKQAFNVTGNNAITFLRAHDQASNGGKAVLISGGPGLKQATIRFTSQMSSPINFVVEIYAKRR